MATRSSRDRDPAPTEQNAFLNSETAVSGLADKFEGTITDARYERWDFKGKAKPKPDGKSGVVMALAVTIGDRDDGGEDDKQYYDCGAIEDFVPNDEGDGFEAVTGKRGFYRDRGVLEFTDAIVDSGAVKRSELTVDPSVFVGHRMYWERRPPKWAEKGDTKHSILLPVKWIEQTAAASASRGRAAGAAPSTKTGRGEKPEAADTANDDDVIQTGVELVLAVIDKLPKGTDSIGREDLGTEVHAEMMKLKNKDDRFATAKLRQPVMDLFADDEFLTENAGRKTWSYNPKKGLVEL